MSMTLQEAAIKSCEDRIKHLESTPIYHYGKRQRERAIELERVKIAALRPVTREQVWRGEWLNFYNDFSTAECSRCGEFFEVSPGETPQEDYFNAFKEFYYFCPSCGAPMTDEAVDMVMERLEAVKDD